MVEIPEEIPKGFKYYIYTYEFKGKQRGGGFAGSGPDAVFLTTDPYIRGNIKNLKVKEVTRGEFKKNLEIKSKTYKDFQYAGEDYYKNL